MTRYVWTQQHTSPTGSTWGSITVSASSVVASYRKTIRTLLDRREHLLQAQALHELALLFVSQGGADAQAEAEKLWRDAVDAATSRLDALEVGGGPAPGFFIASCLLGCPFCLFRWGGCVAFCSQRQSSSGYRLRFI
jgi:hypothetical protein